MVVFGTRPEAIKLAPVIRELKAHPRAFEIQVCVTGQHREMLDQVLDVFSIRPDHDLDLMQPAQTLAGYAARGLVGLDRLFRDEKPDLVIVQGDTTTTFVAALAAFYRRASVAHVEAGLRSLDKDAPFPEEINRSLATRLADFHFAPTQRARENLLREGVDPSRIFVTGNTVIDALLDVCSRLDSGELRPSLAEQMPRLPERFILLTAHRRENQGAGLTGIFRAVRALTHRLPEFDFVFPAHLSPAVQRPAREILGALPRVHLLPPADYVSFAWLMKHCRLILSDSGGVQEEAPSLGKPVLVMREVTERPEGIEAGNACLVGTQEERIVRETCRLLNDTASYNAMAEARNPYGDGHAAKKVVEALLG
jgi:UDP-N-acetylglucosamine 2-epimerase